MMEITKEIDVLALTYKMNQTVWFDRNWVVAIITMIK